jgi:prepilin-type processing-associated H-X9-DG protein
LIELLVVIAIISLLVSILLPSLNRARDLAKAAVCSANLRSLNLSGQFYVHDYDRFLPYYWPGPNWISLIKPYVDEGCAIMACPSHGAPMSSPPIPRMSYGYNESFAGLPADGYPGLRVDEAQDAVVFADGYWFFWSERFGMSHFWAAKFAWNVNEGWFEGRPAGVYRVHSDGPNLAFPDGHGEWGRWDSLEDSMFTAIPW